MYRLNFTAPEFDFTAIEEVRLRFLLIANGFPNSTQLQDWLSVDHELDRLLKFYVNVFQYHIPRTLKNENEELAEDLQDRISMIKVGFAGLANIAGHYSEAIGLRMVETGEFIEEILKYWFSEEVERKQFREESVLTLRNFSTNDKVAQKLLSKYPFIIRESIRIISAACSKETVADDLVRVIANLVQLPATCSLLINENLITKLLPFLNEDFQKERRNLISHVLKTTFQHSDGLKILLHTDVELLSYLLLPLAGGEEFTEEEYEPMPLDLQYLPATKVRDPDPDVRYNLVSSIVNLSSTRQGRDIMRKNNVYLILRELHKFEQSQPTGLAKTAELIEDWVSAVILTDEEEPAVVELPN